MSELVANCPRCKANEITFDVLAKVNTKVAFDWKIFCEAFCVCRACKRPTIFTLSLKKLEYKSDFGNLTGFQSAINRIVDIEGYVSQKDMASSPPPEHLPREVAAAFEEGAACQAIGCFNAAGTMFRLCIDLSTRPMLPKEDVDGINANIRRNLGLRLPWLFDTKRLPEALRDLSTCIKDDGNDGAHQGTLGPDDASDILDFTYALLERIFTEPKRLELARVRREERRKPKA